jgi:hypothetical protein
MCFNHFQAEHSEKPSIIALINLITDKITKKYDAVAVSRTVSICYFVFIGKVL